MNNETVSSREKSDGENLGKSKSRQEKVKQWFAEAKKALSRFLPTEPKIEQPELPLWSEKELRRMRVENDLRANGFTKGVDGTWTDKDWWIPRPRNRN